MFLGYITKVKIDDSDHLVSQYSGIYSQKRLRATFQKLI